jgi:hypothetical protein
MVAETRNRPVRDASGVVARGLLKAVTKATGADPDLVTWSFLRAGQALDLGGQRNEGIEPDRQVIARPNVYDSREQASRGLKKPFTEK